MTQRYMRAKLSIINEMASNILKIFVFGLFSISMVGHDCYASDHKQIQSMNVAVSVRSPVISQTVVYRKLTWRVST